MISGAILIGIMLMLGVLLGSLEEERRPKFRYPRGRCQSCGYALAGLPEGARCPECGLEDPAAPWEVAVRSVVRANVTPRLGLTCLLGAASVSAFAPLVGTAHRWSYTLHRGTHSPEVLANAMRVRGFDLDWELAVIPLVIGLYVCIFCAALRTVRFGRLALKVTAAGWLLSAAWLFVETYVRYG